MSVENITEENIILAATIRTDIRNPFSELSFYPSVAAQYDQYGYNGGAFTKESLLRMFRNLRQSSLVRVVISSAE